MGFILYIIAYILFLPLTMINYFLVSKKGYFTNTAINIDKFGNREFRTLFNHVLITELGYEFGNELETVSSVLGKNERDKTLTKTGRVLCYILNTLDKNHCIKSINDNV